MAKAPKPDKPTVEYNVYVNDMPKATHAELVVAERYAQHYFTDEIYNGNSAPTVVVTRRVVTPDGDVTEDPVTVGGV